MSMSAAIIDPNNALSFGQLSKEVKDTFGMGFSGRSVLAGDRYFMLDRRESFYRGTQHDMKMWDFNGRVINPRSTMPMLGTEKSAWNVPLEMRRPSAPYRLPKLIVNSFTNLLFGEQRFPAIRVDGDPQTEDFQQTIARVGKLPLKMIEARALGGSMGSVGVSWCFKKGRPAYDVHNAKNLFVHSWEDRKELVPRHVSEIKLFYKQLWDGKQFSNIYFWYRRDWTPDAEIVFLEQPYEKGKEPIWIPDAKRSNFHGDFIPHFVWIQNRPADEIDGEPDYEGLYDSFNSLDVLNSVIVRGGILNLDPTLKLKVDPDVVSRLGIRKGSENALILGKDGDADYLQISGDLVSAGKDLVLALRQAILEVASCVIPEPEKVAAQGTSSVAMKMMYALMLGATDVLREQYGAAVEKLIDYPTQVGRMKMSTTLYFANPDDPEGGPIVDEATGKPKEGKFELKLPPKIEHQKPEPDPLTGEVPLDPETGMPQEDLVVKTPRLPGEGGEINLRWPPYFPPTPDDQAKVVLNMQIANGGKAFLSVETSTEIAAAAFGIDPAEERRRLEAQKGEDQAAMAQMVPPGAGGEVEDPNQLPPGAQPKGAPPFSQEKGTPIPEAEDEGLEPDRGP